MTAMPLFDANAMVGALPGDVDFAGPDLLLSMMDRLGIGEALVRHADAVSYDAAAGNQALLQALRDEPRLLPAFVVGPLDCGEHGGPQRFGEHLLASRVRAVWLYPRSHGWSVTGCEARSLLAGLARVRLPVLLDLAECPWDDIAALAAQLPTIPIVVTGLGYRTLRQAAAVLSAYQHVAVDTSFLAAHRGLEYLVDRFGAHRVCFGTGYPAVDPSGPRHVLELAELTDADRGQVSAGTARTILGLRAERAVPAAGGNESRWAQLKLPAGGIVDAHAHIGQWPSSFLPAPDAEDLIASMNLTGTSVSIASSMRAIWSGDVESGNAEALAAARRFPGRLFVHAVANPHRPQDRAYLLDLLGEPEVRGIKIHPHTHECAVDDSRYDWILQVACEMKVPVLGHCFAGTWHSPPEGFVSVAGRYPELTIIAGHSGATAAGFHTLASSGAQYPNLFAELCGSQMTARWIRRLVADLGAARVLHGTDATLIDPRLGIGRVLQAGLSDTDRDAVLAANARRIYRLTNTAAVGPPTTRRMTCDSPG